MRGIMVRCFESGDKRQLIPAVRRRAWGVGGQQESHGTLGAPAEVRDT